MRRHWIQDLFKCPHCGDTGIVWVSTNHVNTIDDDGGMVDNVCNLDEFECRTCRGKIADLSGRTIKNSRHLLEMLWSGAFKVIKQ